MLGALENPIFECGLQVLESVGSGSRRIGRTEKGVGRTERHRKVLCDALGELSGNVALANRRNVAGVETVDGWEGQFVVDAGIVDRKRRRKETVADDFMRLTLAGGNQRKGESGQTRTQQTGRHE